MYEIRLTQSQQRRVSLTKGHKAPRALLDNPQLPSPVWTQLTLDMFQFTLANTPPDHRSIV